MKQTTVLCKKIDCIHALKRNDGARQCACDVIQIQEDNSCNSYFPCPDKFREALSRIRR